MGDPFENLVASYYRSQGYIVESNVWFPLRTDRQRSRLAWADIDVLALDAKTVVFVACAQSPGTKGSGGYHTIGKSLTND